MKDPYGLEHASIPVAYVRLLLEIAAERGVSVAALLADGRLPSQLLDDLEGRVTPRQWSQLVWSALTLTGDAALGYEYGLRLRLTAHGVLGFALMSCGTVEQALQLGAAFFAIRLRDYRMVLRTEGETAVIELLETHPVVGAKPEQRAILRRFFHECLIVGMAHGGRFLTGQDWSSVELWLDWPEPDYHAQYRDRLPVMRFNQATCQLRFAAKDLLQPLVLADEVAHQQALTQIEHEQIRHADQIVDLVARVKAELILVPDQGYPSLDVVAERLHLSGRTLKRRLQVLGSSYLVILDAVRLQHAAKLLAAADMDIQRISSYLGYIAPANFSRAFKKWTGETPSQYRLGLQDRAR
jgi:AraC-like DNA-binding protein